MGKLLHDLLSRRGIDPATTAPRSKLGRLVRATRDGVLPSAELSRILALPRRDWRTDPLTPTVVSEVTRLYRTPGGTMTLLPHQAWALLEAEDHRGLFGDIPVGEGKTILSYLLPCTGPYLRPMLLLPGNLTGKSQKTEREFDALSAHWKGHAGYRIVSFEMLGSPTSGPALLETYMPDCIVIDEAHGFKNPRAGRTRRLTEYIAKHGPDGTGVLKAVFTMSGTYHEDSFRDFHHLQKWSLPAHLRFLPDSENELQDWCSALDTDPNERLDPGALTAFSGGRTDLASVRRGFAERKRATPGVIVVDSEGPGCSITLEADVFQGYGPAVDAAFECLERGERTDGCPVKEAIVAYGHQWTYALGYESYWDPMPPEEWRDALRGWSTACRVVMSEDMPGVDTPAMVANWIDRGGAGFKIRMPEGPSVPAGVLLAEWRRLKPTFTVNVKERRIDDAMVNHGAEWLSTAAKRKLLWTGHVPFAKRLSEVSGVPYFGAGGVDAKGRSIETYSGGPAILSIDANKLGRNLQDRYDDNYFADPPGTCKDWDQAIGRTHRRAQKADVVKVTALIGCLSHYTALSRARTRATNVQDSRGLKVDRKLLLADWLVPPASYFANLDGPRWRQIVLPGRDDL